MPRAWPRSSASRRWWCRPMPGSARRSASCARRSPMRSCARTCSGSTPSTPPRSMRSMRRCAPRPKRSCGAAPLVETRTAFMRYRGQGHEIAVPLPVRPYAASDAGLFRTAFEEAYRGLYSRVIPGVEVEALSWVLLLSTPPPAAATAEAKAPPQPAPYRPAPARRRAVFDRDSGAFAEVAVYERRELAPGARIAGPAVIVEDETATVVTRAFEASLDAFGSLVLRRRA